MLNANLYIRQAAAGTGQFLQGAATDHGAQGRKSLDTANMGPLAPGNGIEPQNPARLPFGFLQCFHSPGLIDGFGVR